MKKYRQLKEAPRRMNKMVYTFGRMNPPTIGHGVVMKKIQNMAKEFQTKVKQYEAEAPTKTDEENAKRGQEIQSMQDNIRQYQGQAQQDMQTKEMDLLKPITEKARIAILKVGRAQGFDYVLDTAQGATILADGKNLLDDVKKELGI